MRPCLLDLFCKQGGAGMGYHRAEFDVTGVDIEPQPRNPHRFIQADAIEYALKHGHEYDAIHASPPCQAHSQVNNRAHIGGRVYPTLIEPTREALIASGLPYVIENVVGAPLLSPVRLCGSSFGLAVRRHRLFETNFPLMGLPCAHHLQTEAKFPTCFQSKLGESRLATVVQVYGHTAGSKMWPEAMGIDWMDRDGLSQAIPPDYTEHIGEYLMREVIGRLSPMDAVVESIPEQRNAA